MYLNHILNNMKTFNNQENVFENEFILDKITFDIIRKVCSQIHLFVPRTS